MLLQGKLCRLRDWQNDDLEAYRFWNSGHKKWMDLDAPYYPKLSTEELAQRIELYQRAIQSQKWPDPRRQLVITAKSEDALIGLVSWYWQSQETNWMSLGITLFDEKHWGKGIGFDALQLWVGYLFQSDESLVRLDLRTWSGNKGMIRLGQKLGFQEEACFRKARIVKGEYYDSIGMGILREEWLARKAE